MKINNCKLSKKVQNKLLEYFVLGATARSAADVLNIHPNSAALFYRKIRTVISHYLSLESEGLFGGTIELDESYFGGKRKGKRGRGAAGKVVVFGILKRGGKVYTVVVDNAKKESLFPVIEKKIMPDSIVYTDSSSSYDVLDVRVVFIICASTTASTLWMVAITSTVLRISGIRQSGIYASTMGLIANLSRYS